MHMEHDEDLTPATAGAIEPPAAPPQVAAIAAKAQACERAGEVWMAALPAPEGDGRG